MSFFGGIYSYRPSAGLHFFHLSFVYARLSALAQAPPCTVGCAASPASPRSASLPLLSEHLRSDVGAQAALGENADSALVSKNRRETPRLELLQRRRNDTSTMLKSGVSVMSAMPSRLFRSLNMDMLGRRGRNIGSSCSSGSSL